MERQIRMRPSRAADLVRRNWTLLDRAKAEYWRDRKRTGKAGEGIRIADELRRQVLAQRPGWPSASERAEDLDAHVRLAEALRRAKPPGRR
jgi:hypothetical protein